MSRPLVGIVDDDESMREAMSWALRAIGLRTAAYESADALLAANITDELACLVLDSRMTGMGGLELQSRLAHRPNTPPIVFVSADADRQTAAHAMGQGAVAFLQKPFSADALIEAVRRALSVAALPEPTPW